MPTISLDDMADRFGEISIRIADPSPAMRVGGIMGLGEVKDRFATQTDVDGRPWAPLKYGRPEGGSIPLRNHGILMASYTSEYGKDFWRVGTNLEKAKLLHFGGTVVPVNKKWLTIPLTREAVYAGAAPNQPGLHFGKRANQEDTAGLYDDAGVKHWHLTKKVVIPPRKQVGVSPELLDQWIEILFHYITTGEL